MRRRFTASTTAAVAPTFGPSHDARRGNAHRTVAADFLHPTGRLRPSAGVHVPRTTRFRPKAAGRRFGPRANWELPSGWDWHARRRETKALPTQQLSDPPRVPCRISRTASGCRFVASDAAAHLPLQVPFAPHVATPVVQLCFPAPTKQAGNDFLLPSRNLTSTNHRIYKHFHRKHFSTEAIYFPFVAIACHHVNQTSCERGVEAANIGR